MTNFVQPWINVQSADGQLHQFEPGTSQTVIDKAMLDYANEQNPSSLVDFARSIPGGLAKGAAGVAGTLGNIESGISWAADKASHLLPQSVQDTMAYYRGQAAAHPTPETQAPQSAPTSSDISGAIGNAVGGYYEPKTTAGKYGETIASFAPAALAPGGAAARIARVVVPGSASEFAGQAASGSKYEPAARVIGALAGGGVEALGEYAAPTVARLANKAFDAATGTPLIDPQKTAGQMLAKAIEQDGGVRAAADRLTDWANSGASDPALIDVTKNNVARLVRSAAASGDGEAQNLARTYADRVRANFQDNVLDRTAELTPGAQNTSASQMAKMLEDLQREDAQTNYAAPYSQPAAVTKDMVSALQGPEGRSAIGQAYATARARRDVQQMGELKDLLDVATEQGGGRDPITGKMRSLDDALSNLSAGSLDRVRIAMRETASSLAARGRRAMAGGYFDRVGDIDTALDQTPGLADARASYRKLQTQRNAVDIGASGLRTPSADYAQQLAEALQVSPDAKLPAQVGYRQAIQDAVESPAAGSTGIVNRLQSSTRQTNNLAATFGPDVASRYQTAIGNEAQKLQNARFIDPNTGSQTALRTSDEALLDAIPTSKAGLVSMIWNKLRSGVTLTNAEKAEIVRLGTTEARLRAVLSTPRLPSNGPNLARALAAQSAISLGHDQP